MNGVVQAAGIQRSPTAPRCPIPPKFTCSSGAWRSGELMLKACKHYHGGSRVKDCSGTEQGVGFKPGFDG